MTWWDHETGSIWSQPLGEAIIGPLKGSTLDVIPSTLTTWEAWRGAHPETLALDVHAWRTAFDLADMAIITDFGTETVAYSVPHLREVGLVNDVVAGVEVAVVIDPENPQRWVVLSRRLDDRVVDLELTPGGLLDPVSGTIFDPFLGRGLSGPLSDQALDQLPAFTAFREDYATFFPNGRVWPRDG
jgi:hypothetical protein